MKRKTIILATAGAAVALIAAVVYASLREPGNKAPAGYETRDTLRKAAFSLWNVLKESDYQPPDGFSYRGDEWGNALDVVLDKRQLKDIPDRLLQGRQFDSPDEMGYLIIVTSRGPDGQPETADDLTYWRINGVEDGGIKGHGEVYDKEVWSELAAYVRRIHGTGSAGGG